MAIPSWVIDRARTQIERTALPDFCDIVRVVPGKDELGGDINVPTTIAASVPCRYTEDLTVREQTYVSRRDITVTARITLPALQDIDEQDYITNVIVDGINRGTFNVRASLTRSWELVRVVLVAKGAITP